MLRNLDVIVHALGDSGSGCEIAVKGRLRDVWFGAPTFGFTVAELLMRRGIATLAR